MAIEYDDEPSTQPRRKGRIEFEDDIVPTRTQTVPKESSLTSRLLEAAKPEIDYPEVGYGMYLGGKRALGAVGQFVPPVSEGATEMARSAQKKIEEKGERQAGALLFDVLGLGKLVKPLQAATATGRMAKTAAVGGGATALTTPALDEEKPFVQEKAEQFAIGSIAGGIGQSFKEGLAKLIPGAVTTANQPTKQLLEEAEKRGITIPLSDLTENAFVRTLDRVFENPLMTRNVPVINRELNRAMGQAGEVIDLGKTNKALGDEVENLLQNKTFRLTGLSPGAQQALQQTFSAIPQLENRPLQKLIDSARRMGLANAQVTGKEWHLARQQINNQYVAALMAERPDPNRIDALRTLIKAWDDAAYNSLPKEFKPQFIDWKSKWTAYSDVLEAANRNEKSRQLILRGVVDPTDLMNVIAKKREKEMLLSPFASTTRPQTQVAALGGGLDVYGREATSVAPYIRAASGLAGLAAAPFTGGATASIPAGLIAGKGLQSYLYSPSGQRLMMRGPSTAPTVGSFAAPVAATRQFLPQDQER